jgi:hypothetical protein
MKKFLFLLLALGLGLSSFAQFDAMMKTKANLIAPMQRSLTTNIDIPVVGQQTPNSYVSNKSVLTDEVTAVTQYDLQTNTTNQRRLYLFPDETIGTTCIWSQQSASPWSDRGTGYNYFDGTAWGAQPTARVETIRTGWPEYHPFGPTGELIIAHQATGDLVMSTRTVKGTGAWTQTTLPALTGITGMAWPRVVTNGANHTNIHIIALTLPTGNGGVTYNGMNGALLYCHSLDGGTTWTTWTQLPGMTSSDYTQFNGDTYSWAEPKGDTIAFTVGDSWMDQFLMKSTDNGTTWTKTVIYHSPYDLGGTSTSFFYCPDGSMSIAFDNQGIAHVVFGLQSDSGTYTAGYFRPFTAGLVYWNENMPQLSQTLNPDTLFKHHQYVAWVKDTMVYHLPTGVTLAYYYTSLTSNPELVIDGKNKMFLAWAGATTLVDPNNYTLRHIFGRDGYISGDSVMWHNDTLVDITGDWIQYNFSECMYPSASPTTDDYVYILFQADAYGGSYVKGINISGYSGQTSPDDNSMTIIKWAKPLWTGVTEKQEKPTFSVGQNFPNPVDGLTKVNVYMQNGGDLSLKVTNLTGQTLMNMEKSNVLPGVSEFVIDASQLSAGVYFYTVKQGDKSITKKMIVQ